MRSSVFLVLAALTGVGCTTPCQALCTTLAEYGDECGVSWSASDIASCEDAFGSADGATQRTCRDFGTPDQVRSEWTCDDVTLFQGGSVPEASDTDA